MPGPEHINQRHGRDPFDPRLLFNGPPFPVSDICPQCGRKPDQTMRAHPWLWIGLWKDRACSRCRIGFRPPRPVWAKVLYLGSLVTLATLLATSAGIAIVPDWHPPWVDTLWLPVTFLAANVFLLLLCMRD